MPGRSAPAIDEDYLARLFRKLEENGGLTEKERDTYTLDLLAEILKTTRRVESQTIIGITRTAPGKVLASIVLSFIVLHEFATYLNIHLVVDTVLRLLGVPVP